MRQSVTILAVGKRASTEMAKQVQLFFSNKTVTVSAFCLDELRRSANVPIKTSLAVISCKPVLDLLTPFIEPGTPVLVARRTLSLPVIDQLMALPAGTKVLLVTKNPIAITEFIQTIQEMGISHISLYSFLTHEYQLCSAIKTILLADEPDQVPPWAEKTIDLGVREIDLSSLIEIANRLNQPLHTTAPISTQYLQEIVNRSEHLVETLKTVDLLNQQLSAVLNSVQDCLIVVDAAYLIRFLNNPALELIGMEASQAVGKPLKQIIPELESAVMPAGGFTAPAENIITIDHKTFYSSVQTIKDETNQFLSSIICLRDITEVMRMEKEVRQALKARGHIAKYTFEDIIGESPAMIETIAAARKLAATELNILICGENGTGKELFAHSLHSASLRSSGPFIAVNCAALPLSLLESELFGYEDGAFTGAKRGGRPGLIERADGGTIFLDEIGDIPLEAQSRLLRVIQEKALMRVGSTRVIATNVRIIAATNRNLLAMISQNAFRQDLFYRLFVAPVQIPPLRQRQQDIPLLLKYFMRESNVDGYALDNDLLNRLLQYPWPGNIRELQSVIQYAAAISGDRASFKKAVLSRIEILQDASPAIPLTLKMDELPLYTDILAVFAEAKQRRIHLGRGSLLQRLRSSHPALSEQTARNKMVRLKEAGFLSSGQGRQGTQITESGEAFLAAMRYSSVKG